MIVMRIHSHVNNPLKMDWGFAHQYDEQAQSLPF